MLSYQHAYHAGNFADVHKHLTLYTVTDYLLRKKSAVTYIDTHAGRGLYPLDAHETQRLKEYRDGIWPLWQARTAPKDALLLAWLEAVAAAGGNLLEAAVEAQMAQLAAASPDADEATTVSIEHVLTGFKDNKLDACCKRHEKVFKFKTGQMKLKLKIPTLQHDAYVNEFFKKQLKPLLKQGKKAVEKHLEKILSQTFFIELSKLLQI